MQVERSAAPVDSAAAQPMEEEVGRRLPTTSQVERPAAPVNLAQAQPMEVVSRFPMTAQVERP
uniref:Uncharacterized protein n=1 Tax=Oryza barthii TaxID=65489 RepID=A0A0D3FRK8_9ORYZ